MAAAIIAVVLAFLAELLLGLAQRMITPRGLRLTAAVTPSRAYRRAFRLSFE